MEKTVSLNGNKKAEHVFKLEKSVRILRLLASSNYHDRNPSKVLQNISRTEKILSYVTSIDGVPVHFRPNRNNGLGATSTSNSILGELKSSTHGEGEKPLGEQVGIAFNLASKMNEEYPFVKLARNEDGKRSIDGFDSDLYYSFTGAVQYVTMIMSSAAAKLDAYVRGLKGEREQTIPRGPSF